MLLKVPSPTVLCAPHPAHPPITAARAEARMCYSKYSFTNRAWRKKNKAYPELSLNCPLLVQKVCAGQG